MIVENHISAFLYTNKSVPLHITSEASTSDHNDEGNSPHKGRHNAHRKVKGTEKASFRRGTQMRNMAEILFPQWVVVLRCRSPDRHCGRGSCDVHVCQDHRSDDEAI